jgi:hypothetical protein
MSNTGFLYQNVPIRVLKSMIKFKVVYAEVHTDLLVKAVQGEYRDFLAESHLIQQIVG